MISMWTSFWTARDIQAISDIRVLRREEQSISRCLRYAEAHMGCEGGEYQDGMMHTYVTETTEEQRRLAAIQRRIATLTHAEQGAQS